MKMLSRWSAAAIALAAWIGLALQFTATISDVGSVRSAFWVLSDYFTVLTNLAVAIVFTRASLRFGDSRHPRLIAGLTLAILLVGAVYAILLRPIDHPHGIALVATIFLHMVTPILVALFWLTIVRKGALRAADPLLFALFPLIYFAYAMARGAADGHYPYFFINVTKIGVQRTLVNAALIAAAFLIAGYVLLLIDRTLRRLQKRH